MGPIAFAAILAIKGLWGGIRDVNEGSQANEPVAPTPVAARLADGHEAQEIDRILSGLDENQLRQLQALLGQ
jgi:hypothetical protein